MKVMVLGSSGFVGRYVCDALAERHEVIRTSRSDSTENSVRVDLSDRSTIEKALKLTMPEVILNCAGVIKNDETAQDNVLFTTNLLGAVVAAGLKPRRIIISGSAGEYGNVASLPVSENTPLNATSSYASSKAEEERAALQIARERELSVVVARIFNPIGPGMNPKQLLPNIIRMVKEIESGLSDSISVSRLDSIRDYVDVRDIARALLVLIEGEPSMSVYNIGSGRATSNAELIDMVIKNSGLDHSPEIVETVETAEQMVASQADISRISDEFGWTPRYGLEDTIKEIWNER